VKTRPSLAKPTSINELNADLFQPEEAVGVRARGSDPLADPAQSARKKAMDYLARREYGQDELARKLATAGFDSDVAADAVARLAEEGLQSDDRFAGSFVQSRINQGKGPVRIRQELKERGLRPSTVDRALDEVETDWYDLAREVRVRKFGADLPAEFSDKARQMRFLQYRGFESDQIQAAVSSHGDELA
jgi:regulatory protein